MILEFVETLAERWQLTVGARLGTEQGSGGWAAPATRADGTAAVLKLGMLHP